MTLIDAAKRYLDVFDNERGPHRRYKLNAVGARFQRAYYLELDESLWGGHKQLAGVAREIAAEAAKGASDD